jgi:hypothetical protein
MNKQFGCNEDRKGNQESDVCFNVAKKQNSTAAASRGLHHDKEQERQPCA